MVFISVGVRTQNVRVAGKCGDHSATPKHEETSNRIGPALNQMRNVFIHVLQQKFYYFRNSAANHLYGELHLN